MTNESGIILIWKIRTLETQNRRVSSDTIYWLCFCNKAKQDKHFCLSEIAKKHANKSQFLASLYSVYGCSTFEEDAENKQNRSDNASGRKGFAKHEPRQ